MKLKEEEKEIAAARTAMELKEEEKEMMHESNILPFKYTLVASCIHGRPLNLEKIKVHCLKHFQIQKNNFKISSLGSSSKKNLQFRFDNEEDFIKLLVEGSFSVQGYQIKLARWSPEWCPTKDSTSKPIWLDLPLLPPHFYNEYLLKAIGNAIGECLQIAPKTSALRDFSAARLCVEMSLLQSQPPEQIWIGIGDEGEGFWQKIDYLNWTSYCSKCCKQGHEISECSKRNGGGVVVKKGSLQKKPVANCNRIPKQTEEEEKGNSKLCSELQDNMGMGIDKEATKGKEALEKLN